MRPTNPLAEDSYPSKGEFIEVSPAVADLPAIGERVKLVAAVRDARGRTIPNAPVTWQTTDANVATVDGSGTVTGVGEGMTEVRGTSGGISATAVIAVAKPKVNRGSNGTESVALSPESDTVPTVGSTIKLLAVGRQKGGKLVSNEDLTWQSGDPSVATVNKGTVTGLKSGEAEIVVVNGSAADTATVSVAPPDVAARVEVTPAGDTIPAIGGTASLVGRVYNGSGTVMDEQVTWTSLDPSIATVSGGTVTGLAKGIARIRGSYGTLSDTARIWVAPTTSATSVFVTPKVDTIPQVGGTTTLTGTALDGNGAEVTATFAWTTMDPGIATVNAAGTVKGNAKGVARIIVRLGTLVDTATVHVAPTVPPTQGASLTLAPKVDTMASVGQWLFLTATIKDAQGTTVTARATWASLDPAVATVIEDGEVKSLAKGVARITATYNGLADTATVHVAPNPPTPSTSGVKISPRTDTIPTIGGWAFLTATVTDTAGQSVNASVNWAALDPAIAVVVEDGEVRGVAPGQARIVASYGGMADTALVHVAPGGTGGGGSGPSLNVTHSPSSPVPTSTVTITASVSGTASITSTSITVDGSVVKTCPGSTCSYSAVFPAGAHSYSASAEETSGGTLNSAQRSFTVWQPSGGSGGSATTPHWSHARMAVFDYRIHYLQGTQQASEYDQAASRYDFVVGGDVDAWKSRNPYVQQFMYDLIVGERQQDVGPMESWLANRGYNVEDSYLHQAGTSKTKTNRVAYYQWTDNYWALNPSDPGQIAWREHISKQYTAQRVSGYRYDGLFFDVLGSSSGGTGVVPAATLEFGNKSAYNSALHSLLAKQASWSPSGRCVANTGNTISAEDAAQADACGATAMEFSNDIYSEMGYKIWGFVQARLAAGTQVMLIPQRQGYLKNTPRYNMNAGNYGSVGERVLLAEYANYLMIMDPSRMDLLNVDFYLTGTADPSQPHAISWLKAFETDLGQPLGARSIIKSGTDGGGQPYDAFKREFTNGLVVYRPMQNWARTNFGDATAVTITLPAGTWRMLAPNGALSGVVTTVQLRNGEAAIFVKS